MPSRASPRRLHLKRNPDLHLQTNFGWNRQRRNFSRLKKKRPFLSFSYSPRRELFRKKSNECVWERVRERVCVRVCANVSERERERKRASRKVILNLCATHSDFLNVISSYFSGWHRPPPASRFLPRCAFVRCPKKNCRILRSRTKRWLFLSLYYDRTRLTPIGRKAISRNSPSPLLLDPL